MCRPSKVTSMRGHDKNAFSRSENVRSVTTIGDGFSLILQHAWSRLICGQGSYRTQGVAANATPLPLMFPLSSQLLLSVEKRPSLP
ncbi:hypothetical protein M0804_010569 [Polistes exclamans]|nr:hypothetical protein M0804_010569 [Polistes exclamans]